MKKTLLCFLLFIAVNSGYSQVMLKGDTLKITSAIEDKLKKQISNYKLFTLDIPLLYRTVKGKSQKTEVKLILDKDTLSLTLFPHDVRSSNYSSNENGKNLDILPLKEIITYRKSN